MAEEPRPTARSAPRVTVVHADLDAGGGAEAYTRAVIEVCRSMSLAVDVIDVSSVADEFAGRGGPGRVVAWLLRRCRRFKAFTWAIVLRYVSTNPPDADLCIFAYAESGTTCCTPHVQILHAPAIFSTDAQHLRQLGVPTDRRLRLAVRRIYTRSCASIAGSPRGPGEHCLATITNSAWTAARAREAGTACDPVMIVRPPIRRPAAPTSRERSPDQVVMLGRLVPGKRHTEALAVVRAAAVRTGRPLRLAIVGRGDGAYVRRLKATAKRSPDLVVHAAASDEMRDEILATSAIGFHVYRDEHFGISIGEMILAGCVPLVHDGGGGAELVPASRCRFVDTGTAVDRLVDLLSMSATERQQLLVHLQGGAALDDALNFSERFAGALRSVGRPGLPWTKPLRT